MARRVQGHPVYAGMIEEMDEAVATVLAAVAAVGARDRTLVIFTSDNGGLSTAEGSPTSNLPLRAGKGHLYEGGLRVPLLVRWPGVVRPGTTSDVPVTTLDLAADPGESRDLSAARPDRARQLRDRLQAWRLSVGAALPRANPEPVDPFGPRAVRGPGGGRVH